MMDDAFGYWLAGLIDGEGCFRVKQHRASETQRLYFAPTFSLKLRDDDRELLDEIRERTGLGLIARDASRSGNSKPCAIWRVDNLDHLQGLVDFLDRYPLKSRKRRDYVLWREAVVVRLAMPKGNRWHGARDWTRMAELKQAIEDVRVYA